MKNLESLRRRIDGLRLVRASTVLAALSGLLLVAVLIAPHAHAQTPDGLELVGVTPGTPSQDAGFTLTDTDDSSPLSLECTGFLYTGEHFAIAEGRSTSASCTLNTGSNVTLRRLTSVFGYDASTDTADPDDVEIIWSDGDGVTTPLSTPLNAPIFDGDAAVAPTPTLSPDNSSRYSNELDSTAFSFSFNAADDDLIGEENERFLVFARYLRNTFDNYGIPGMYVYVLNDDYSLSISGVSSHAYTKDGAIAVLVLPEATGGQVETTYSVSTLPPGLTFDPNTRQITGTPTTVGTTTVTYTATDFAGATGSVQFNLVVTEGDVGVVISPFTPSGRARSKSLSATITPTPTSAAYVQISDTATCDSAAFDGSETPYTSGTTLTFSSESDNGTVVCFRVTANAATIYAQSTSISDIDTVTPLLSNPSSITTPANDATPEFTFTSSDAGTITYGGSCASVTVAAISGENTVVFDSLSDGRYDDCTVTVTNEGNHISDPLVVPTFVIDTTGPNLRVVSSVETPTNDVTPEFTFSSNEAGSIVYAGGCSSTTVTANVGNNVVVFETLAENTYSSCTVTVTDALGNVSTPLSVPMFVVDTTAPVLSNESITTPTADPTPDFTFDSTEAGDITYEGSCDSTANTTAEVGANIVTFDELAPGTYNDCTLIVTDAARNPSVALSVPEFEILSPAPVLTDPRITTLTNDTTPRFTFTSSAAGTITYTGSCSSTTVAATVGENEVVFTQLSEGPHAGCTVTVTDANNNVSNVLVVPTFIIDTTAPALSGEPITTPTDDQTPNFSFTSSEAGTITYGGSCRSTETNALNGRNTVTFETLSDDTYSDCTVTVTDEAGNASTALSVPTFVVDTTPPTLSGASIDTLTNDPTPEFTFTSSEAGTITYGGFFCRSTETNALNGRNTVRFETLSDGTYSDCTVTVTDALGNVSTPLSVPMFVVDTVVPVISNAQVEGGTPTSDRTPRITFTSSEMGDITYGGSCTSTTDVTASVGSNAIDFDALSDEVYSDCTLIVTDAAENASAPLPVPTFVVDTTAPTLSGGSITTPASDPTPDFTFTSSEAGTIAYAGGCTSTKTDALNGSNTVTFNMLDDGTYNSCTVIVTDAAENASAPLSVPTFVIDAPNDTAPVLSDLGPVPSLVTYPFLDITFTSSEAGTLALISGEGTGECVSTETAVQSGSNTITLGPFSSGIYECRMTVVDGDGNTSFPLAIPSILFQVEVPALIKPGIEASTDDTTPDLSFISSEAGTLAYAGGCTSTKTDAVVGANTVTFDELEAGEHTGCTVTVTDSDNNTSAPLAVPDFIIVDGSEVYSATLMTEVWDQNELAGYDHHSGANRGTLNSPVFSEDYDITQLYFSSNAGTRPFVIRLADDEGVKAFAGDVLGGFTVTFTQGDTTLVIPSLTFAEQTLADEVVDAQSAPMFKAMLYNTAEPITVKFFDTGPEASLDFDGSGSFVPDKDALFLYLYTETEALPANLAAYVHDGTAATAADAAEAIDAVRGGSSSPLDFDSSGSFVPDKDALFLYLYTETEALPANLAAYVHDGTAATAADAAEEIDALTQ